MANYAARYPNFPAYEDLAALVHFVDGRLHWKAPSCPVAEAPTISVLGQRLPTRLVTWVVSNWYLPEYHLHAYRSGRDTEITNLVEVLPAGLSAAPPVSVILPDPRGGAIARAIPRRDQRFNQLQDRIIHRQWFPTFTQAAEWGDAMRAQLQAWRSDRKDKPSSRSGGHQRAYPTLPELPEVPFDPDYFSEEFQAGLASRSSSAAAIPPPNPQNLDMLSLRACERFVGTAIDLSRQNTGYQADQKDPSLRRGATLTVTLGAYDGSWRCRAVTVLPDGTKRETLIESQPQALLGWSVTAHLQVRTTPGKAPQSLRKALLDLWRARPPTRDDLRRARAFLTPAPIPRLGVDRRSKEASPVRAAVPVPQGTPGFPGATGISIPAVLDRLFSPPDWDGRVPYDPKDHFAPGNIQGLQVHVERTTAGFLVTLRGTSRNVALATLARGEPNKYEILSRATIAVPIPYQKLQQFPNRRAVFAGIVDSLRPSPRFISSMAEAITDRLEKEKPKEPSAAKAALPMQHTKEPAQKYSYSPDRFRGSPRSFKVTITTMMSPQDGGPLQPTTITTYLANAITLIKNEDLSDPTRTVPYYTAHRRILRGWDPRKAIMTPRNIRKEPTD